MSPPARRSPTIFAMADMLPARIEPEPVPEPEPVSLARRIGQVAAVLPDLLRLAYRLMRDPRVPVRRRMLAGVALGYVVLPFDVIPDAIPGLGQADDVVVVAVALRLLMDGAGAEVVAEHWDGSAATLELVDTVVLWGANLVPGRLRRTLGRLMG